MNIGRVMQVTGLTRKALYYYESIGLVVPAHNALNGYREYSEDQVKDLNHIGALRSIGIGFSQIAAILAGEISVSDALAERASAIGEEIAELTAIRSTIVGVMNGPSADQTVINKLSAYTSSRNTTVRARLAHLFPGPFGALVLHMFGQYLDASVESDAQEAALEILINELDKADPIELPESLAVYFADTEIKDSLEDVSNLPSLRELALIEATPEDAGTIAHASEDLAKLIKPVLSAIVDYLSATSEQFRDDIPLFETLYSQISSKEP